MEARARSLLPLAEAFVVQYSYNVVGVQTIGLCFPAVRRIMSSSHEFSLCPNYSTWAIISSCELDTAADPAPTAKKETPRMDHLSDRKVKDVKNK